MNQIDSRRPHRMLVAGLIVGAVAVAASACGGSDSSSNAKTNTPPAAAGTPKTVNIDLIGKTDADKGPPGTFTSKAHWPAVAPSDLPPITKGDTVVLTIKEYDSAATELPAGSPYNAVQGGTMTLDGKATTTVPNTDIAHTFSIQELGINVPLAKAPEGKFSTTVFTFTADKTGTFTWHCWTPCGGEPKGMGGSMAKKGWMTGGVTVA